MRSRTSCGRFLGLGDYGLVLADGIPSCIGRALSLPLVDAQMVNTGEFADYQPTSIRWDQWLSEVAPAFPKHLRQEAVQCMDAYEHGMNWLFTRLRTRGVCASIPEILASQGTRWWGGGSPGQPEVIVPLAALAELAKGSLTGDRYRYGPMGMAPLFVGFPKHFMALRGIEEPHHSVYLSRREPADDGPETDIGRYHAVDHELRAHEWKIRYARVHGFPPDSIESLHEVLRLAKAARAADPQLRTLGPRVSGASMGVSI